MSATIFHNPFRPTAGAEPPRIIGRDDIALEFTESLNSGIGAPARLMRVAGPRGSGKTVLLCDLRDRARELGWKTAIVSAGPNLLLDLKDQIAESSLATNASVGVNAGFVSAKFDVVPKESSLRKLLGSAAKSSKGLFIAIDEVQDAPIDDMRAIASAVQLLIGEKVDIALAFAGLPAGVMDLINGKALTFLRRALPEDLAPINQVEVALSMGDSFIATGLTIEDDLCLFGATGRLLHLAARQLASCQKCQRERARCYRRHCAGRGSFSRCCSRARDFWTWTQRYQISFGHVRG